MKINFYHSIQLRYKSCIRYFIYLCIFIVLSAPNFLFGQENKTIDSLLTELKHAKQDTNQVKLLIDIGWSYYDALSKQDVDYGLKALALAEKLNYKKGIARANQFIGRCYWRVGNFAEAQKYHLTALEQYREMGNRENVALTYTFLGQDHADAGDYFKSIEYLQLSLKEYQALNNKRDQASVHSILSFVYLNMGKYAESTIHQYEVLKLSEAGGDKFGANMARANLASTFIGQGRYTEAIETFLQTVPLFKEAGDMYNLIITYNDIGRCYSYLGNYHEALNNHLLALDAAVKIKNSNSIGESYSAIAMLTRIQNKISDALSYYYLALDAFIASENKQGAANTYNEIGKCLTQLNRYAEARKAFDQAYVLSEELKSISQFNKLYGGLVQLDSATGDWRSAFEHHKLFISTRDSMYNDENTKKIVQTQMQYDFDKKEAAAKAEQEKKDAEALATLQRQKLIRNGFMSGFGIVMLFAVTFFYQRNKIKIGKKQSDELLLNILPSEVADELKAKGSADAKLIDHVTVLFSDFKNFTQLSGTLTPSELVAEINECFSAFDHIMQKYGIEKIKTIGDAYMAAGGLPTPNDTHAVDVIHAALDMQQFMLQRKKEREAEHKFFFEARFGAHTGPVVAGIVGVKKFAYDIWGDTVNLAQRMESNSETGKINISGSTYELIQSNFNCTYRGKIEIKGKGAEDMYFVEGKKV